MRVRRLPRTLAPFAAAVVTVAVVAAIAGAHDTDFSDPNDSRGRLDIEQVRLAHQPGPPKWTLATFGEWRTAEIWDRGYLMVFLDTQGGAGAEHYLLIRSSGTVLEGSLWRLRNVGPDSYLGSVPVDRWSRRSATVQVGLSRLTFGASRAFYRWWTETLFTGELCRRTCHDRCAERRSRPAVETRDVAVALAERVAVALILAAGLTWAGGRRIFREISRNRRPSGGVRTGRDPVVAASRGDV